MQWFLGDELSPLAKQKVFLTIEPSFHLLGRKFLDQGSSFDLELVVTIVLLCKQCGGLNTLSPRCGTFRRCGLDGW